MSTSCFNLSTDEDKNVCGMYWESYLILDSRQLYVLKNLQIVLNNKINLTKRDLMNYETKK